MDIRAVIQQAKAGDRDAFALVYEHYYSPIYRYLYSRTNDRGHAEDLTQEVFIKAYRSLVSFTVSDAEPLAYFYTIARNVAIDFNRKKRPNVTDPDEAMAALPDERAQGGEGRTESRERIRALHASLAELPEDQREAITLKFISELSNREIARAMKKSEEAIRQLQSRGVRALNELFTKHYEHGI